MYVRMGKKYIMLHNRLKPMKKRNKRVKRERKFSGKRYYYSGDYATKTRAKAISKTRRKHGDLVRVEKVHGRFVIYHRKKK